MCNRLNVRSYSDPYCSQTLNMNTRVDKLCLLTFHMRGQSILPSVDSEREHCSSCTS